MQNPDNMGLTDGGGGSWPRFGTARGALYGLSGRGGPRAALPAVQFSKIRIILQITSAFLCYRK
jgi:hypothetical protein